MSNKSKQILVVDDELSMREFLELFLSREGYKVSCAENGKTAISLINKKDFDLLLCDIRLGDISGLDVLRAAKKTESKYCGNFDFRLCICGNRS